MIVLCLYYSIICYCNHNFMWKGIKVVGVLLPPVLISAGNWRDVYVFWHVLSFAIDFFFFFFSQWTFIEHPEFYEWHSNIVLCSSRSAGLHRMEREWAESGREWSMNWRLIEVTYFLFIWDHITVQSSRQEPSANEQHVTKQFDWLISDRGPFHHSKGYLSFMERFRQGFTTRYKIYRWVHLIDTV